MKKFLALFAFLLVLCLCASALSEQTLYRGVVTKDMTIRQTRSTSGKKLGEVHADETVSILEFAEKWAKIEKDGLTGYILSKNITDLSAPDAPLDASVADYVGVATSKLTVRKTKSRSGMKLQEIAEGETVYVTSLEGAWLGVVKQGIHGYVLAEPVAQLAPAREGVVLPEAYETMPLFEAVYSAQADIGLHIRKKKDVQSASLGTIAENERIDVMLLDGQWAYVRKGKTTGYVLQEHLRYYKRYDAFGPFIPDTRLTPLYGTVLKETNLLNAQTGELIRKVSAGSILALYASEGEGLTLPYHRVTAAIADADALDVARVVPWDAAQPGDVIAVFSTYFDEPTTDLQRGRIFNIEEGVRRVSGTVVQPDEVFSFNAVCAPYTKGNGYALGPIVNYVSSQKTGYSGGICQVSTTLYNACLQIPIDIVKQQVHSSYGIFYAPLDMDAAVGAGNLDLRLRNALPYSIRFDLQAEGGVITVRVLREG